MRKRYRKGNIKEKETRAKRTRPRVKGLYKEK